MGNHQTIDTLPSTLIERLSTLNPNFNTSDYLNQFGALQTNLHRVNFVYKDLKKYNLFPKFVKDAKNDEVAKEYKEVADEMFVRGNYIGACQCYTKSIVSAKSFSSLAWAYANRSACLSKMNMFQDCIIDIERALAKDYPANLRPKLIERRKHAESQQTAQTRYHEQIPKISNSRKQPRIECAKNCVTIENNEEFGRHVVAVRDIQIGEVICVERPFASFVTENRLLRCHVCLELCNNPIPCENCTLILFCAEDCKNKALNTYHKYECPVLLSLVNYDMEGWHLLALRTALLARDDCLDLNALKWDEEERYCSNRYREIHNLIAATDKRPVKDLFQKAVVAAVMFQMVQNHTNFFNGANSQKLKQNFKEILLLQLQITQINQLDINENSALKQWEKFAVGIYSFSSLFNHSCCHNVDWSQYGSAVVFRAVSTIKTGQQCCICYGPQYNHPKSLRQLFLARHYFFDCKCTACENDWSLRNDPSQYRFPLFVDLDMSLMEFFSMKMLLVEGDINTAKQFLPRLKSHLTRHEKFEPWGNALEIKNLIGSCYRTLGNKRRV